AEWARLQGIGFKPVRCIGEPSATRSHELRDLLTRNGLLHEFVDAATPEGRAGLRKLGRSPPDLPVVGVPARPPLAQPPNPPPPSRWWSSSTVHRWRIPRTRSSPTPSMSTPL